MRLVFNNIFLSSSLDYIGDQIVKNLTPLQKKVAIFATACFALMLIASVCFCAKREMKVDDLNDDETDDFNSSDIEDEDEKKLDNKDGMGSFRSSVNLQAEEDIKALVEKGDFDSAWIAFLSANYDNSFKGLMNPVLSIHHPWNFLPPVELIQNRLNTCATAADILKIMPPEFIRDCLIAYPKLQQQFLKNDLLGEVFNAYQSYIADICMQDKNFAEVFIFSPCSKVINNDENRLAIFEAAYQGIIKAFKNDEIDIEAMKYLSLFLLNHRLVISKHTYDKVKKIETVINNLKLTSGKKMDDRFSTLIKLVISKLNEQGIFTESGSYVDKKADPLSSSHLSKGSSSDEIEHVLDQLCQ